MSGASAGAAAAGAAKRRREHEEEEMSGYTPAQLGEGWEFKILRSATGAFRDPERLRQALAEEARAGWTLVEKFDNERVRLKRPASAREGDAGLGVDPYRTTYGISGGKLAMLMVLGVVVLMGLAATVVVLVK